MGLFRGWLNEARMEMRDDYPLIPGFKFGIEIEGLLPREYSKKEFESAVARAGFNIEDDYSVSPDSPSDYELFHHKPFEITTDGDGVDGRDIEEVISGLEVLEKYEFYLNRTTGIHIHVSHEGLDSPGHFPLSAMLNLVSLFDEPGILKRLKHREGIHHARSMRSKLIHVLNDKSLGRDPELWKDAILDLGRYLSINFKALSTHRTVEFRLFGTLGKFKAQRDVAPYLRYISNVFQKALETPYQRGKLKVVGNRISIRGEESELRGVEEREAIKKSKRGLINLLKNNKEEIRGKSFFSTNERVIGYSITGETLEKAIGYAEFSRKTMNEFISIFLVHDINFQPKTEKDKDLLKRIFDLFIKFDLMEQFQDFIYGLTVSLGQKAVEDVDEIILDWARNRPHWDGKILDSIASSFEVQRIPPIARPMLLGILSAEGNRSGRALKELYKILSTIFSGFSTEVNIEDLKDLKDPEKEAIDKSIEAFEKAGKDELARVFRRKWYQVKKGPWVDKLKEKEEEQKKRRGIL